MQNYFKQQGFSYSSQTYYPHVKLANTHMDNVMNRQRKEDNFPNEELQQLNFTANKVILYESKLLLHHAHHTPLVECLLN
jgi:NAD-dependent oxidoreductase involved in siderophore biosynthesis